MAVLLANSAKSIGKLLTYSIKAEINSTASSNNVVVGRQKEVSVVSEKFSYQPFDSISVNRVSNFSADCDAYSRPGEFGIRFNDNEIMGIHFPAT